MLGSIHCFDTDQNSLSIYDRKYQKEGIDHSTVSLNDEETKRTLH